MLQNAWLREHGYLNFKLNNPSLALPTDIHVGTVNPLQSQAGLWDTGTLRGMTAYENIRANINVLKDAGIDRNIIAAQARQVRSFVNSLPCP